MPHSLTIAAAQMCSGVSVQKNLQEIAQFATKAAASGVDYLLTPEMSVAFVEGSGSLHKIAQAYDDNEALDVCAGIARQNKIHLHIGSLAIALDNGQFANRSVLFSPDGKIVDFYDKIHLFDAELGNSQSYRESAHYRGGERAVLTKMAGINLGMSICYDLRFASLYRQLALAGAHIISAPAAFTVPTGTAHWQVLIRARAIETGCYIIAAAQGGAHENGRTTYGHSMIVDPWGKIIAQKKDYAPGLIMAKINTKEVKKARMRLPALANRAMFSLSVNHNEV
ncbi:FIG003879: Predicted amidohydrolase [hydrothermal vent metagenome]|uniref:FIG003879: Predicted amidohydrolase n=1 Tax=hydrothermal vent metagenome TaxID=652676 RepID=A0A3B0TI15_9ZZZZ